DFPGNFTKYQMLKEERLAVQTRTYEKYVEEVEKAKDFIRRHHYGMKAAQAEDRRKKLERLEEEPADLPRKITTPGMRFPAASRTGDLVFRIEGLSKGFSFPLFQNLTLDMQRGQRWAIIGPNGCGKSTFLKCLLGEEQPDAGRVQFGEGVKVGYFDQQIKVLDGSLPVVEAIRPKGKVFEDLQRRNLLGSFGLSGDQQLQAVESLSGGQRCRAALAKLSAEDPNVMILDEPTNHLDLWAREALEKALKQFDGTVIFISHDRYFVDQVADHLLIIQPDAKFRVLDGNYSTFRYMVSKGLVADPFLPDALADKPATPVKQPEKKTADILKRSSKAPSAPGAKPSAPPPKNGGKKKKSGAVPVLGEQTGRGLKSLSKQDRDEKHAEAAFKEEQGRPSKKTKEKRKRKFPYRKVSDIEEEVFIRETQVMTLQDELLDPNVLRDGNRVRELHLQIQEEEAALKLLYEHWEEASELNG
ncbi:MAG: ATP-binding cassette domain-containing protein, partial [Planctomycetia bacterium]|nr:ATP-binding cassette domain-containing protein [Planctomycetia bacterium]